MVNQGSRFLTFPKAYLYIQSRWGEANHVTQVKQAIILAGGMGTRVRPLTDTIPKPMIRLNNRPFLEYLMDLLKENGISEVVLLLGYLHEKIVDHFQDGSKFGMCIHYSIGDVSFKTGKRIKNAENLLKENFLLMYCDNYWPLNIQNLIALHSKNETMATVTVFTNKDSSTKNNMLVSEDGYVMHYDKSRTNKQLNGVEIGFYIVNKNILKLMPETNFSFEKEILPQLIQKRQLSGYLTDHKYYSIGSLERLSTTEKFLSPKQVIFLDRDGVINKKAPKSEYITSWAAFEFLPGAIEALALLAQKGYIIFIITNQAGIARGFMTETELEEIHEKMKNELDKYDVRIEKIYHCPHGWDDGCECRKPKPGMLYNAAKEYNLDLSKTCFIGDDQRDLQAGTAAGCKTILVNHESSLLKIVTQDILHA